MEKQMGILEEKRNKLWYEYFIYTGYSAGNKTKVKGKQH